MDTHITMRQAQESFMSSRSQKVKGRDDILAQVRGVLLGVVARQLGGNYETGAEAGWEGGLLVETGVEVSW